MARVLTKWGDLPDKEEEEYDNALWKRLHPHCSICKKPLQKQTVGGQEYDVCPIHGTRGA